jgi:hypothetical protein
MADYSFLSKSDRFKQLQSDFQQSLLNLDRSQLEPIPPYTAIEYVHTHQRDERYLSRSTCSLQYVPALPGFWYWRPVQIDPTLIDLRERCQARFLARQKELAANGIHLVLDISKNCYFWSTKPQTLPKQPHSLPVETAENEKKCTFLPVAQESRKTAKKFGFCNTQTIAGRPAKIDIKKSDFLTR